MEGRAVSALFMLGVLGVLTFHAKPAASQDATPVQSTTPPPSATPPPWLTRSVHGQDSDPPAPASPSSAPPLVQQAPAPSTPSAPPIVTTTTPPPAPVAPLPTRSDGRFDWDAPAAPPPPADTDAIYTAKPIPNAQASFLLYASVGVDWLRQMPRLSLEAVDADRHVAGQDIATAGPLAMWRAQVGADIVLSRWLLIPLVGIGTGSAVGSTNRVIAAADGSPVEMRPWTTGAVVFSGPGIGARVTHRRWMFSGSARVVASHFRMGAAVTTGRTVTQTTLEGWMPGLRLDIEACRRVGPLDRACFFVEARTLDTTTFNGGSMGLRWEFGG